MWYLYLYPYLYLNTVCVSVFVHLTVSGSVSSFTWSQLHPGTDLVNHPSVAEKEQTEADHGAYNQQHGGPNEEHGRPEGRGWDGGKVQHTAFTGELRGESVTDAVVEEAEVPGLWGVDAVPDPEGLDEDHHGDDDEADGEHGPHHTDGSGVSHIVGVVDFGSLLRWQQIHDSKHQQKPLFYY